MNLSKKEIGVFFLLSILILVLRLWYIADMQGQYIFADHIGYWGHAANLNGLEWKNTTNMWYSYGYSILVVPLFWITHNMIVIYKLAVIINAFLGVIGFVFGIAMLRELDEKIDLTTIMIFSFAASCYSAYIFQSYIGWPETLIYTFFSIIAFTMLKFCKRPTMLNTILVTIELAGLYVVHNRNIVVIMAFIITLWFMFFTGKTDWKKIAAVFLIFSCLYFVNKGVRLYLIQLTFDGNGQFGNNNFATVSSSLINILNSPNGIMRLFQSLAGKLWYLLSATFMLAYVGFVFILKKLIKYLKREYGGTIDNFGYFYIFILLLILGTTAVNVLSAVPAEIDYSQTTRLDVFFYGRYSDGISGLLIIFGLVDIAKNKGNFFRRNINGLAIYCLCSGILYFQIHKIKDFKLNPGHTPGVWFFTKWSVNSIIKISIIIIFVYTAAAIVIPYVIKISKQIKKNTPRFVSLILAGAFWIIGKNGIQNDIIPGQNWGGYYSEVYNILNNNSSQKVFFLPDSIWGTKCVLRTRAVESEFCCDQLPDEDEENYFVIVSNEEGAEKIDLRKKDYYLLCHTKEIYLICEGKELVRTLTEQGCHCPKIISSSFGTTADGKKDFVIKTEDDVFIEKMFGKRILNYENIRFGENELIFDHSSNVILEDKTDDFTAFKLSMEIWLESEEGDKSVEIINKWNSWLNEMTFAFSFHQDSNMYFLNLSSEGNNVEAFSWSEEKMPRNQWNTLEINFNAGKIEVLINGNRILEEQCEFSSLYVSNQPVTIGERMTGKIKKFEYEIY